LGLRLVIELSSEEDVEHEWTTHFSQGAAFVRDTTAETNQACTVVVICPRGRELELAGRTVWCGEGGVGVALDGWDRAAKDKLETWLRESETEEMVPRDDAPAKNVYERVRNLPLVEQVKLARDGELAERIALERVYGKTVWEALLRNPRITPPEIASIARKGQLPRPLLELIASTTAWLRFPEVRRALLVNGRVPSELHGKILRLLSKHELKLVPTQTAYPPAVRDAARRLLKEP
jgi:hypothetical protein